VDYDFFAYEKSCLQHTNFIVSLQRAIELKKQFLELGITNYEPKLQFGAEIQPYIYFIKHYKEPSHSKVIANLLTKNISQPDNTLHRPFKKEPENKINMLALMQEIKQDQHDRLEDDVFLKASQFHDANILRMAGIYNLYPEFKSAQKSSITLEKDKKVVLLGTNSYLGAANRAEVTQAAKDAIDKYGTGCSGSPLLNGTLDIHNLLEKELTEFMHKEAVILCSTGYQTNLAGISVLCEPGDVIIMDERSHRSLFDGAKMSGATYFVYRHNDINHLEKLLQRLKSKKKLIITDSVFSMEGIIPDLKGICDLAKKYHARLFIDEAHGIGVFGKNGRGVCEMFGIEDDVDLIMATFSKSFSSIGGFITGNYELIDYIKHKASAHIFSASLPPAAVATIRAVLKIIQKEPQSRQGILDKAKYMAEALNTMGYRAKFLGSQIVPIVLGNDVLALAAYKKFMENRVYVNPIVPPAVPKEFSGFRTSYMASHEWQDLDFALEVFNKYKNYFV